MNVLLDTQAFLWWASSSTRLSDRAADVIGDPATMVHVSVASAWEIAIKTSAGRLELEVERVAGRPAGAHDQRVDAVQLDRAA